MNKRSERGQVLILLLLIVLVMLTVVLAIAERSTSSLSNSDKSDQSSRAYSAAEAGVESFQSGGAVADTSYSLGNQSSYSVDGSLTPSYPTALKPMLEYPPTGKETIAQFWLVPPDNISTGASYNASTILMFFGNYDPNNSANSMDVSKNSAEAIEVDYISCVSSCGTNGGVYKEYKHFYDSQPSRAATNGFDGSTPTCATTPAGNPGYIATDDSELGSNRPFRCKVLITLDNYPAEEPMLMRVRVLYNDDKQSLALDPVSGATIPVQAALFTSTGISGNSIQKIRVFQEPNVVIPFMDYALFSYGDITK